MSEAAQRRAQSAAFMRPLVVAQDTGTGFIPQAGQRILFDESAGLLHLVEGRMVSGRIGSPLG